VADLSKYEQQVDKYIEEDDKEAAVKLLYKIIVTYARAKNFTKAEALREKLFEVDATAFNEIIRSGDIIEEEKSESIDEEHWKIWSKLYGNLTTENANTIYYAMQTRKYGSNQVIYNQGDQDSNLYFVNSGKVNMVYTREGEEILLKTLTAGDVAGEDTFFSGSAFRTTSLTTMSPTKVHFLERHILKTWKSQFPGLEAILNTFCQKQGTVESLLEEKKMDRRVDKRVKIIGPGVFQLLSASGKPASRRFRGDLDDISTSGFSFYVRITQRETAQMLLGRKINSRFALTVGDGEEWVEQIGTIVGVRYHPFGDHSIHVKFDQMLSPGLIHRAENITKSPSRKA